MAYTCRVRQFARFTALALPLIAAAGTPLLVKLLIHTFEYQISTGPDVPFLLSPNPQPGGCVRSSVTGIIIVLVVSLAGAAVAEISKVIANSRLATLLILLAQIVVVEETVRCYAYDWWRFAGSVFGIASVDTWATMRYGTPWLAIFVPLGAAALIVWHQMRDSASATST